MLKIALKKFAADHVDNKPRVFLHKETQKVLSDFHDNEDHKDLLNEICTDNNDVNSSDDDDNIGVPILFQCRNGYSSSDYLSGDSV